MSVIVIPVTTVHRATTCVMTPAVAMEIASNKMTVQNNATAIMVTRANSVTLAKLATQSIVKTAAPAIAACATVQWIMQANSVRKRAFAMRTTQVVIWRVVAVQ